MTIGYSYYNCNFNLLGYRRDKLTKEIVIIPEEAEAVKKIYSLYIQVCVLQFLLTAGRRRCLFPYDKDSASISF